MARPMDSPVRVRSSIAVKLFWQHATPFNPGQRRIPVDGGKTRRARVELDAIRDLALSTDYPDTGEAIV
jgi:hypothetical protein